MAIAQAPLTEIQKQGLARIDEEEVVRLASDLIRIPSFTTEETPCAEWLGNYFGDQGLAAALQEIEPGRKQAVARLSGRGGGRSIMLNGHIDIDPRARGWTRDPFQPWIADGKPYGHGIYNIKAAGIPCGLYGSGGGYTDYDDVHTNLDELLLVTRVLALTALETVA